MSLDSDVIVDRRRMRRKLTFWRILAVLVAIVAVVAVASVVSRRGGIVTAGGDTIARISITGLIRNDQDRVFVNPVEEMRRNECGKDTAEHAAERNPEIELRQARRLRTAAVKVCVTQ